jgi:hypothetical protein
VLVTNLHNLTQPLIRYELTDRFTPAGTAAGGFLRASVEGRSGEVFRYGSASVSPFALSTALLQAAQVREYQVRQTARGRVEGLGVEPGENTREGAGARRQDPLHPWSRRPPSTASVCCEQPAAHSAAAVGESCPAAVNAQIASASTNSSGCQRPITDR